MEDNEMTEENLKKQIIRSIDRRVKAYVMATGMTHNTIRKHISFGITAELEDLKKEIESMEQKK